MKLITARKDIVNAISDITATGRTLDALIWQTSCSIIQQVENDGNNGLANTLIAGMPKGSRVNAVIAHMEKYGKLRFDADTKTLVYAKTKTTDVDGAMSESWVDLKPEPPYQAMTLEAAMAAVITKAKARVVTNDVRDDINVERLDQMAAMQAEWAAEDADGAAALAKLAAGKVAASEAPVEAREEADCDH